MPHESEKSFEDRVYDFYIDKVGKDNVERQKYMDKDHDDKLLFSSGTFCDLWVEEDDIIKAIEIENDEDSVRPGAAQARYYSRHHSTAVAIVIVPPDHVENIDKRILGSDVAIVELNV